MMKQNDNKYEVMVVGDELLDRDWIIRCLTKEGYSVIGCSDGEDVNAFLESMYGNYLPFPDIALIDPHNPEIISQIREKCDLLEMPEIPCIVYMETDLPALNGLFKAGMAGFIQRHDPPDEITLLSSINAHIKDNVLGIGRTTILNHESIRKDT